MDTKSNKDSVCHRKRSGHFIEGMWLRNQGTDGGIWKIIPATMRTRILKGYD